MPSPFPASTRRRLRRPCAIERRNTLVHQHQEMVRPIALHYGHCSREACDDLIQVGMLGLIRAAELFDPRQGTPFTVFARPHIRGAILHHLRDLAPAVRLPRRQAELQERLRQEERQGRLLGRNVRPECLQSRLGIDAGQWSLLMRHRQLQRPCSLSELPVEVLEAAEQQAASQQEGAEREAANAESPKAAAGHELIRQLDALESQQRQVVLQVVLGGASTRQLARTMGVSPMTVQRRLQRGLDQLRRGLEAAGLSSTSCSNRVPSAAPGC